jgi:DNA-binding transcriptional MocR family regulator
MTLPRLKFSGAAAGMQLLLQLPDQADDLAIAAAAASQGIGVRALSPLHLTPSRERGLLLGYGRLSESQIEPAVRALSSLIAQAGAADGVASSAARKRRCRVAAPPQERSSD